MAAVWPAFEGTGPNQGEPWLEAPAYEIVDLLMLSSSNFISSDPPRLGEQGRDFWYRGYKHIIAEILPNEPRPDGWKAGYYQSPLKPKQVSEKLIFRAIALAIGSENIDRVERTDGVSAYGEEIVRILVVIRTGAETVLSGSKALAAIYNVNDQLARMNSNKVPVIEYVTIDELEADAVVQL